MTATADDLEVIEVTIPTSPLDRFRRAALTPDAPLDAQLAYLRELSTLSARELAGDEFTDDLTYVKAFATVQAAVRFLVEDMTREVDAEVRAAPPSGLAEVVRDVMTPCLAPTCNTDVTPWQPNPCSPDCEAEAQRAVGA